MANVLIGFGYKARNGKDTAAKAIIAQRSDKFDVRRYAFADELKREYTASIEECGGSVGQLIEKMRVTHNLPQWVQYEFDADMTDPLCPYGKHRKFLQWWGTEYRRYQDPFYWVKKLRNRIAAEEPQIALITDLRFPNEYYWIRDNKGFVVKVSRTGFVDVAASSHPSEHELDGYYFDYEIEAAEGEVKGLEDAAVAVFDMVVDELTPKDQNFEVPDENKTEAGEARV